MNNQFDSQIICVDEEGKMSFGTVELQLLVEELKEDELFTGKLGDVYLVRTPGEGGRSRNSVFVGIGNGVEANRLFKLERAFGKAVTSAKNNGGKSIVAWLDDRLNIPETSKAIEAMHLAKYRFEKYKTLHIKGEVSVAVSSPHDMKAEADEAILLAQQTCFARDLVNEPPNVLTPSVLAEIAVEQGEKCGFFVDVYEENQIAEKQMGAFLSVAKGSAHPPKLIILRYDGGGKETIGLVGKGLTYDSGGYSLKSNEHMKTMKSDMGGAAAVLSAVGALAKNKVPVTVVGVIAACENMVSGLAYKPDDIVHTMSGRTVEIQNTDAEGRLTLADAVTYAIEVEKVDKVIDIATLTGAAVTALGDGITAGITNNLEFWKQVEQGARLATEKLWQLPNDFDTVKQLRSDVADLRNVGGSEAGCITAGQFVGEFAGRVPWVHLDIAGPAFLKKATDLGPEGATGVGVRMLYYAVKNGSLSVSEDENTDVFMN